MSALEVSFILFPLFTMVCVVFVLIKINALRKEIREMSKNKKPSDPETLKLQLQAYERLSVLSERISLQNLMSRIPNKGLSSREMQMSMIENIKSEYDYNVSQQIYIDPGIWKAVDNFKEQNIYIINQLASRLPPQASGMDLNKQIVDFLINNPKASPHDIVHEAINYEAKKLL